MISTFDRTDMVLYNTLRAIKHKKTYEPILMTAVIDDSDECDHHEYINANIRVSSWC